MRAMVLTAACTPLREVERPDPEPGPGQALLRVLACGVCRTDLHVVDGELTRPKLPLVPGHEIVAEVVASAGRFSPGDRVGVPWLGWTCGACPYCRAGRENLCDRALFTGYDLDGGYAELCVADERFCFAVPPPFGDVEAAPLLCAAAHIVCQVALHQGREVYALTRPGDEHAQSFARSLGTTWAGDTVEGPPVELDAAILFAPAGELVPKALGHVRKGGTVVCAGIHMSDIPSFPYELLWGERVVRSVANLTRADGDELLVLAPEVPVETHVEAVPLVQANEALARLRAGDVRGALVLVP